MTDISNQKNSISINNESNTEIVQTQAKFKGSLKNFNNISENSETINKLKTKSIRFKEESKKKLIF
jgi:hypothetical protein